MTTKKAGRGLILCLCFLLCLGLLLLTAWGLGAYQGGAAPSSATADPYVAAGASLPTVVIDAGHGGEDGGASSASGVVEKDVNLAVALSLRDLLEANGIPTVMTRTADILLYDRTADYKGHKKSLDLAARRAIADSVENCILVSIHMNAYPAAQYSGLQVWYSPAHPDSQALAEGIQTTALSLMPSNNRKIKAAGSSIYLLHHATYPAVLVECGFLSNPAEAERLGDPAYQQALALVIFSAVNRQVFGGTT